jgi:hypothetical protein
MTKPKYIRSVKNGSNRLILTESSSRHYFPKIANPRNKTNLPNPAALHPHKIRRKSRKLRKSKKTKKSEFRTQNLTFYLLDSISKLLICIK